MLKEHYMYNRFRTLLIFYLTNSSEIDVRFIREQQRINSKTREVVPPGNMGLIARDSSDTAKYSW